MEDDSSVFVDFEYSKKGRAYQALKMTELFPETWIFFFLQQLSTVLEWFLEIMRRIAASVGFMKSFNKSSSSQTDLTVFDGLTLRWFDRKITPETLGTFIKKLDDWPRNETK